MAVENSHGQVWQVAGLLQVGPDAVVQLAARMRGGGLGPGGDDQRGLVARLQCELATPSAEYAAASDAEQRRADAILDAIMPVSRRRLGLLNDSRLTTCAARVDLEAIRAPTVAISARDDGYGTLGRPRHSTAPSTSPGRASWASSTAGTCSWGTRSRWSPSLRPGNLLQYPS